MSAPDPAFDALVSTGPIVDNASERFYAIGQLEYDGPRCDGCGDDVETDGATCPDCGPCPTCRGAGGWQQHDGSITECPRGCATGERAA